MQFFISLPFVNDTCCTQHKKYIQLNCWSALHSSLRKWMSDLMQIISFCFIFLFLTILVWCKLVVLGLRLEG